MNTLIEGHNDKVEQLHEFIEWFVNKYEGCKELRKITQNLQDASIQIGKLVEKWKHSLSQNIVEGYYFEIKFKQRTVPSSAIFM